jgi:hypothetical protein
MTFEDTVKATISAFGEGLISKSDAVDTILDALHNLCVDCNSVLVINRPEVTE